MRARQRKKYQGNYRGLVIDDMDPLEAGRIKVKVFGVHDEVEDNAIPWAIYSDPLMGSGTDFGGFIVPDVGAHVWVFFEEGEPDQPVYWAGAPARIDMPSERFQPPAQYPRNKVFKTKAGHVIELDDSPENTRIRIKHKSGTHKTIVDNGDTIEEIVANLSIFVEENASIYVKGDVSETVEGNLVRQIQGDVTEIIEGDYVQSVSGDSSSNVGGRMRKISGGGMDIHTVGQNNVTGTRVNINSGGGVAVSLIGGEFVYTEPYAYTFGAAYPLVRAAGTNAPFDTPEEEDLKAEALASGEYPEEEEVEGDEEEVQVADGDPPEISDGCPVLSSDVYNTPLGSGIYTVRDFTLSPVFPHPIQSQVGLSVEDIVCNLHHLCLNIVEPIRNTFPELNINSAFRRGSGSSQHVRGMAVDLQASGRAANYYRDVLEWIAENLPYDQCLIESSGRRNPDGSYSWWVHLSYNPGLSSQRKSRMTYLAGRTPAYTNGWNLV